ncbi:MAG: class I SAM-dependent methyltransferase [Acidimicrobiales bacterium]
MARYPTTTVDLDLAEQRWWHEHADLEERFCWVQPPEVQRRLRGHYLRRIAAEAGPADRVLEVGCGAGWLSLRLAEAGVASVTGIDFSPEQIRLAQAASARQRAPGVSFEVASVDDLVTTGRSFDVVLMHAFLHHLSTAEIREALAGTRRLLAPGGRLLVLEPVMHGAPGGRRPVALRILNKIERLPLGLSARRLRPISPEERAVRHRLEQRPAAEAPFGPAPKEVAFESDELVALLEEQVRVDERMPVASACFLVAEQLLLAELSQPRLWKTLRAPVLRVTSALDRRLVGASPPPDGVWIFELLICRTP